MRTGLRLLLLAVAAVAILVAIGLQAVPGMVRSAVTRAAGQRGHTATFRDVRLDWGPRVRIAGLVVTRTAGGDTVMIADSLDVQPSLGALLRGSMRPQRLALSHARIDLRSRAAPADPDTLEFGDAEMKAGEARVRRAAEGLVQMLLVPARTFPSLDLADVVLTRGSRGDEASGLRLARLSLRSERGNVTFAARGVLEGADPVPFEGTLTYGRDDRLQGSGTFTVPDEGGGKSWPLQVEVDGRVRQDRRHRRVELPSPLRVRLGEIELHLTGHLAQDGPAYRIALTADSLSGARLERSLPPPVLGPLARVGTRGTWDYRARLDLDFARLDSVDFAADVIPHGLALAGGGLNLYGLDQPFTAQIHLPRDRIVLRDLSRANPHFRELDRIDPWLVHAVVTNEDGAFFRHRGFNTDAVKEAIAENIRAGAFRRGAGTITMQLARNLWLGHERTLSRKAQEVMLAWVLEHLTGLSKQRLLEIYLNVIEWGPGLHGADEAARFYFGHDAGRLTIDEALLLTILVPSPAKWKWRFDREGRLRPFARAQMHFIGRAMIAKGWLAPEDLPPADQLDVRLRGPARDAFDLPEDEEREDGGWIRLPWWD